MKVNLLTHTFRIDWTRLCWLLWLLLGLIGGVAQVAQAQVSGTVFRDFNANGTYESTPASGTYVYGEPGTSGILVTAYPATGSPVSVTTSSSGTYTFSAAQLPAGTQVRLEFTNLAAGDFSGPYSTSATGNRTSVQFVTAGASATNVNFAVNYSSDYCQDNPQLITPCYVNGDNNSTSPIDALVVWLYNDTGTSTANKRDIATKAMIGSTWGVAYSRTRKRVYTAAFLKRHVGVGPGGLGAIYVTDPASSPNATLLVTIPNAGTIASNSSRGLGDPQALNADPTAFSLVGTIGLGDLDISDDEKYLYVTNLNDKRLYIVDIASQTVVTSIAIPDPACTGGQMRPFALAYQQGKLYVGLICDATSSNSRADLKAFVYVMDAATNSFSTTPVLQIDLNYLRSLAWNGSAISNVWYPWLNIYNPTTLGLDPLGFSVSYPTPLLSDLEFDTDGSMILGFSDRTSHQIGSYNSPPPPSTQFENIHSGGDILRATPSGNGWTIEPLNYTTSGSVLEFYSRETYGDEGETAQGGLTLIPGKEEVVTTAMDPIAYFSGGVIKLSNKTGTQKGAGFQVYINSSGFGRDLFSKATGLGDLEALCDPAPIEIGNRVFRDDNKNGVQDPNEPPIVGARVSLYNAARTTVLATATTNTNGEFYFTSTTTASLTYNTGYALVLTNLGSGTAASGLSLSSVSPLTPGESSPTNSGSTLNNNDAVVSNGFPTILLTTGSTGANNHTFDFGLALPVCSLTAVVTAGVCNSITNTYSATAVVTLANPTAGVLTVSNGTQSQTATIASGLTSFTYTAEFAGLTSDGASHTVTASLPGCDTITVAYTAPVSCSVAPVLALSVTPATCRTATNSYDITGTISMTAAVAGTLTITDGASTTTVSVNAGQTSAGFSLSGLISDGLSHTVTVSGAGYSPASITYTAPVSCSIAPVCSISATVTAGLCASATNTYSATAVVLLTNTTAGVLTVSNGLQSLSTVVTGGLSSFTFTADFSGLLSDGASHTVTASMPGCDTTLTTYTAPVSCSAAPVCSLSAVATPGLCSTATNTYASVVVVTVNNPTAGQIVTVTDGVSSQPFTTSAGVTNTFTAIFNNLASDRAVHTVVVSLPGCGSSTTTYTAPAACTVVSPVCSLSAVVTAGVCESATSTYSLTATVTVLNPVIGSTLTVSNGLTTQPFTTTAAGSNTFTMIFTGQVSDGASHTVTASLPGCDTITTTYTAPVPCSAAPICSINPVVTPGVCNSATNTYSVTAVVTLQNTSAGILTVTNGAQSLTTVVAGGLSSFTYTASFSGLISDGLSHTVTASLPGCGSATIPYTAPVSCSFTPVCSIGTPVITVGVCNSATNTYSVTAVVTLQNPTGSQTLSISNGLTTQPFTTTAGSSNTFTMVFAGLTSDGASHSITASLPGCGSAVANYTAPVSCSAVAPVFDLALRKTLAAGQATSVTPGSSVTFTMTIFNQGNVTATNINVVDYIPTGLTLNDVNWTATGSTATLNTAIASLSAGASTTRQIVFTVGAGVTGSLVNKSEISSASGGTDLDSTPDTNSTNDAGGSPNTASDDAIDGNGTGTPGSSSAITDEDDEDVAVIGVTTTPICSINPIITPGVCNSATNTYSLTAVVTLENPVAGVLTVSSGTQSQTIGISGGLGSFTYTSVFAGLVSDGASHTVVSSLAGCGSFPFIYTAPTSCSVNPNAPSIDIQKLVDKSVALQGDTLTYTLVMTNTGTVSATNVVARDSSSSSLIYLAGSVNAPAGTTFTQGLPLSLWTVANLSAGQSLTLTYRAVVNGNGVIYNVVTIPGFAFRRFLAMDSVCTSVPILVCAGSSYAFALSAPAGSSEYRFYNGSNLVYQGPLNSYTATTAGSYSIAVTGQSGCPSGGCCPIIIQETSLPATLTVTATSPTCTGTQVQANGMLTVSGLGSNPGAYTYQFSAGSVFNPATATAVAPIPASGVLVNNLTVAQLYTVRVFTSAGCYRDITVSLIAPINCACPPAQCVPLVISRSRSVRRG